jgi:hypothetical protein
MYQFMGEEGAARVSGRGVLTGVESDVRAGGVSVGMDGAGGIRGVRVGVDADIAEVAAKAWLEEGAGGGVERMAGGTQDVADDARSVSGSSGRGSSALDGRSGMFLLALFTHFFACRT